jgi:hypothetical protein
MACAFTAKKEVLAMRLRALLVIPLLLLLLPFGAAIADETPQLDPGNEGGLFVVEDALEQFIALKHHGEGIGWNLPDNAPDPNICDHYQGVARHPAQGVPVFYVTQSDGDSGFPPQQGGAS